MIAIKYIDAVLPGVACLAVARIASALGFVIADLPDLATATKDVAFDPWNMGAAGFVVWYAWYTTSRVIPKLTAEHRKDMAVQADKCAAERAEMIAAFRAETAQIRADHKGN